MTQQRVVALTGATGFIGSHICKTLDKVGYRTRLLIRNPDCTGSNYLHSEIIQGDLHSPTALTQLTQGADYLIHCAGRVKGARAELFEHDNAAGTYNIVQAASQTGSLKKCIYLSSLSARHPELSFYAASKLKSEQCLAKDPVNSWYIIRPPAVYGPGDKELRPLLDAMSHGMLWLPGNIKNRFSLLHIYDLCCLISMLINSRESLNLLLEPDDGTPAGYSWVDVKNTASSYFERNIYTIPVPRLILTSAAYLNVLFSKSLNYMPMLTPGKVKELTHSNWVADQNKSISGWSPEYDLKAGLATIYNSN